MSDPIYHYMFPSLILEKNNPDSDEVKTSVESSIFNHISEDGWAGEPSGFVTLHLDPAFDKLFKFVAIAVNDYIARMYVDPNDFDCYIVKTWANITKNDPNPIHNHADAHLSFVYYVNIPDFAKNPILFHNHANRHQLFPGFTGWNSKEWDMLNSGTWRFFPAEGNVMVFPATMNHETVGDPSGPADTGVNTLDELRQHRVSIAGDIILTYKKTSKNPLGLQPVTNWVKI
jgi:hypothetical protein